MKVLLTDFALKHFEKASSGTKILDYTPERFQYFMEQGLDWVDMEAVEYDKFYGTALGSIKFMEGYAPFCKLIAIKNFTDAKLGSMPIAVENYQYLRSGYSARTDSELPVLSRWFELPVPTPKAEWLVLVLYSKEQIDKEKEANAIKGNLAGYCPFDAEWGIITILGQSHSNEEPMAPITAMRNALGVNEGGSGVILDKIRYQASVDFWSKNAIVK